MAPFIFALVLTLLISPKVFANPACAVCTVAVGAALGISRKLGVDDTVIGVWFGALLMIMAFWLMKFCTYKKWHFKGINILLALLSFSLIIPLYTMNYISFGQRTILGIDSFLLSAILGAVIIWATDILYRYMKMKNGGHAHFPFEKVAIPVICLTLASVGFYFIAEGGLITNNLPEITL